LRIKVVLKYFGKGIASALMGENMFVKFRSLFKLS
jgi:hypothetical protein